ncbi:hypothetical protein V8F20_012128 [Naviculisporaceae sp. PSN 640]
MVSLKPFLLTLPILLGFTVASPAPDALSDSPTGLSFPPLTRRNPGDIVINGYRLGDPLPEGTQVLDDGHTYIFPDGTTVKTDSGGNLRGVASSSPPRENGYGSEGQHGEGRNNHIQSGAPATHHCGTFYILQLALMYHFLGH